MKRTFIFIISASFLFACSTETTTEISNSEVQTNATSDVPSSDKETEVIIIFSSGFLKGTHVFKPDASNPMSQINVGFSDNVSNLNATGLISEDGKHRLAIGRPFIGEAVVGAQKAKQYTNDCGFFIMNPQNEEAGYTRIDGAYQKCASTDIRAVGEWEESTVYNRRGVVAQFKDKAEIEIRLEDGTTTTELVDIDVTIKARESRLK